MKVCKLATCIVFPAFVLNLAELCAQLHQNLGEEWDIDALVWHRIVGPVECSLTCSWDEVASKLGLVHIAAAKSWYMGSGVWPGRNHAGTGSPSTGLW